MGIRKMLSGIFNKNHDDIYEYDIRKLPRLSFDFENIMYGSISFGTYKNDEALILQLRHIPNNASFKCPSGCFECCGDTILFSHSEYNLILHYIATNWNKEELSHLYNSRLGLIRPDAGTLICPFLDFSSNAGHCGIYTVRPWVCRSFGTSGLICKKFKPANSISEDDFNLVQSKLIFAGKSIRLNNKYSLLLGTFDMWVIADSGKINGSKLLEYLYNKDLNLFAKIYDIENESIISLKSGEIINTEKFS